MPFFYTDRRARRARQSVEGNRDHLVASNRTLEGLVLHQVPPCEIVDRGATRKEMSTEVRVFATPERLWQVILESQKMLSKVLETSSRGRLSNPKEGYFAPVGKKGRLSRASLTHFQPNRELGWKQREFLLPGMLARETLFEIVTETEEVGVTLVRSEVFTDCSFRF